MTRIGDLSFWEGCAAAVLVLGVWAVLTLAVTWVWMWAWNLVVPPVFHGPTLTYWQAFALSVLVGLIGSGFKATINKGK